MPFKKSSSSLSDTFAGYLNAADNGWSAEFLKSDQPYAISNGDTTIKRLRVILKDGSYYSLPYSLLPVLIYTGEKLIIKSYGIHISIYGKGLSIIENYASAERLLYIRESATGIDTENHDVFISVITIEGKNLSTEISEEEL